MTQCFDALAEAGAHFEQNDVTNVVTIGNFDGVHIGHQALIARAKQLATEHGHTLCALTFSPHPVRHFAPHAPPFELTTPAQKAALFSAHTAADYLVLARFDDAMARVSARDFAQTILVDKLRARHVIIGEGFRFGHKREGTTQALQDYGKQMGFEVTVLSPIEGGEDQDERIISSTRIREHVRAGRMQQIPALLGRPYSIHGPVVHGDARGRELGFPTANVDTHNELLPPDGIYTTSLVCQEFGALAAITYIGDRPTYGEGPRQIETYALFWDGEQRPLDLYDKQVEIVFHTWIRGDKMFESSQQLIEQMDRDVAQATSWHRAHTSSD